MCDGESMLLPMGTQHAASLYYRVYNVSNLLLAPPRYRGNGSQSTIQVLCSDGSVHPLLSPGNHEANWWIGVFPRHPNPLEPWSVSSTPVWHGTLAKTWDDTHPREYLGQWWRPTPKSTHLILTGHLAPAWVVQPKGVGPSVDKTCLHKTLSDHTCKWNARGCHLRQRWHPFSATSFRMLWKPGLLTWRLCHSCFSKNGPIGVFLIKRKNFYVKSRADPNFGSIHSNRPIPFEEPTNWWALKNHIFFVHALDPAQQLHSCQVTLETRVNPILLVSRLFKTRVLWKHSRMFFWWTRLCKKGFSVWNAMCDDTSETVRTKLLTIAPLPFVWCPQSFIRSFPPVNWKSARKHKTTIWLSAVNVRQKSKGQTASFNFEAALSSCPWGSKAHAAHVIRITGHINFSG